MNKLSQILQTKKLGFSLAEALITLLIVCLITLASIPILTKKKRGIAQGASGKYLCTVLPSYKKRPFSKAKIEYKYVHYNSQNPIGDINNPTTWEVSGAGDHCKFVPPLNAKNFGVTLIGGGGAGGNGVSKLTTVLDYNNPTYRSTAEAQYVISMVGGGAGGGGGSPQSGVAGSGGGGGGFILGKVTLPANKLYSFEIGEGSPDYGSFSSSQSAEPRAQNGGDTKFKVETPSGAKVLMTAGGGTGGQTRTCKNRLGFWKCGGGNPSPGGVASIDNGFEARRYFSSFSGDFGQGYPGSNVITSDNYSTAGAGIPVNDVYYGAGGRGRKSCRNDGCAENGTRGTFSLSRHDIFGGKGGSAAIPLTIPIPRIEGYLKIKVGAGGAQFYDLSKNGEPTIVEVYNSASKFLRQYVAQGGIVGAQNTEKTPTVGDPSLWNNTGGGAIGTCTEEIPAYVTYETREIEVDDNQKCKYALGICPYYDASEFNYTTMHYSNGRPSSISTNTKTYDEINRELKNKVYHWGAYSFDSQTSGTTVHTVGYNIGGRIVNRYISACNGSAVQSLLALDTVPAQTACTEQQILEDKIIPGLNINGISPDDPDYNKKLLDYILKFASYRRYWAMTTDKRYSIEYECLEYEKKKQTVKIPVFHPAVPATCERAGSGRFFGAGGGGGAASDTVGVAGEGGFGAPGLVIIEW